MGLSEIKGYSVLPCIYDLHIVDPMTPVGNGMLDFLL